MSNIDELLTMVFNHPITYIIIIIAGAYLILKKINEGKLKPEQKPDFGMRFRAERTQKHLSKREAALGEKPNGYKAYLFKGIVPMGRILVTEGIPRIIKEKHSAEKITQLYLYSITYRRFGFAAWLKASIGFGKHRILVDESGIKEEWNQDKKQVRYIIEKDAYFRERGGILFLSKDAERKFIDEINADMDYENAKGFVSDFPRRLSNLDPGHAIHGDTLETEQHLEEKTKAGFLSRFKRGG